MDRQFGIKKESGNHNTRSASFLMMAIAFILVFVFGYVDFNTDPHYSLLIFYLVPVFIAAWYISRMAGLVIVGLSAVIWSIETIVILPHPAEHPLLPYWETLAKIVFFIFIVYILSALRQALDAEKRLARIDFLTGVANRRYFFEAATRETERARRYKHPLTLAYIDVDDFKRVNDRSGHKEGDELLRTVGNVLKSSIRATDMAARVGGDEFVVVFPETAYEPSKVAVQRIRQNLDEAMRKRSWPMTFSIGAVTCLSAFRSFDALVTKADDLMYDAKKSGKNMVRHEVLGDNAQP